MNLELIQRVIYLQKEVERLETLETAVTVEGAGAITLIETKASAASPTISFTNIASTYTHLLAIGSIRSTQETEAELCQVGVNGIGLPNAVFDCFISYCFGAAILSVNVPQRMATGWFAGNQCPANMFTPFTMWFFFYKDTKRYRQCHSISAYGKDKTAPDIQAVQQAVASHWMNNANAISRIDFQTFNAANNFAAGSTISLYGVNGS